jgi:hypothetical protein
MYHICLNRFMVNFKFYLTKIRTTHWKQRTVIIIIISFLAYMVNRDADKIKSGIRGF